MDKGILNSNPFGPQPRKSGKSAGYDVSQTKEAIEEGLNKGQKLVRTVERSGHDLRDWATKTLKDTKELIRQQNRRSRAVNKTKLEKQIWEIMYWENEVGRRVRSYFLEISNSLAALKKLNPPLNSQQLGPFLTSILNERRITLVALEPLTKSIDEIQQIKSQLSTLTLKAISSKTKPTASQRSK